MQITKEQEPRQNFLQLKANPAQSGSMALKTVNPLEISQWNQLVLNTPGHTIFHTKNWAQVLMDTYSYNPYYIVSQESDRFNVLTPLMEVNSKFTGIRGICLPFSDYCNPIIDEHVDHREVYEQINTLGRQLNWNFIEFRGEGIQHRSISSESLCYRHVLSLEGGEAQVRSRLRNNYRRKIKKALNSGAKVEIYRTRNAIKEYYRLHCLTRKKHGLPPQPFQFFENIYRHIIREDLGFVVLASYQNKYIAGAVYFHFGDQVIYKFGASDTEFLHIPTNFLVMWNAIEWSCKSGYKTFCFGKTEPSNTGLVQYKDGWGAEKQDVKYTRNVLKLSDTQQSEKKSDKTSYAIFRKMPLPVLKMAGNLMYRHVA